MTPVILSEPLYSETCRCRIDRRSVALEDRGAVEDNCFAVCRSQLHPGFDLSFLGHIDDLAGLLLGPRFPSTLPRVSGFEDEATTLRQRGVDRFHSLGPVVVGRDLLSYVGRHKCHIPLKRRHVWGGAVHPCHAVCIGFRLSHSQRRRQRVDAIDIIETLWVFAASALMASLPVLLSPLTAMRSSLNLLDDDMTDSSDADSPDVADR